MTKQVLLPNENLYPFAMSKQLLLDFEGNVYLKLFEDKCAIAIQLSRTENERVFYWPAAQTRYRVMSSVGSAICCILKTLPLSQWPTESPFPEVQKMLDDAQIARMSADQAWTDCNTLIFEMEDNEIKPVTELPDAIVRGIYAWTCTTGEICNPYTKRMYKTASFAQRLRSYVEDHMKDFIRFEGLPGVVSPLTWENWKHEYNVLNGSSLDSAKSEQLWDVLVKRLSKLLSGMKTSMNELSDGLPLDPTLSSAMYIHCRDYIMNRINSSHWAKRLDCEVAIK